LYISQFIAKGFKSLDDVSIRFSPGLNAIVGKNNCGKSNVIEALDLILGEKAPTYLSTEDKLFHVDLDGAVAEEFLIAVKLSGAEISEEIMHEEEVGAFVRRLDDFPSWTHTEDLRNLEVNGKWMKSGELVELLKRAEDVWFYLLVPRNARRKDKVIGCFVKEKIGSQFKWNYLYRFRDGLRDALLTTVKIPSFRDPANQLRITSFNWYGQLIKSLYLSATVEQQEIIQSLQNKLSNAVNEVYSKTALELRKKISEAIFHHEIGFRALANSKDDAHKSITIFVNDGIDSPYYDKGSGIQSALVMALFESYCDRFHQGGSLLLAEEPELFLHPHARRMIEQRLRTFASCSLPGRTRQVIMTTHASEFLRGLNRSIVTVLSKRACQNATTVSQIDPVELSETQQQRWKQIISGKNAEVLFSDHAILVEGGEEHLIEPLADLLFKKTCWFDSNNISVVRADGKRQFADYAKVLDTLAIPYTILTDLDFLKDGVNGIVASKKKSEALGEILTQIQTEIKSATSTVNSEKVRNSLSPKVLDAVRLYSKINQYLPKICEGNILSDSERSELLNIWNNLQARIEKPNLREILFSKPSIAKQVIKLIAELKIEGVFVLAKGELEDYYTDTARSLNRGDSSKDRRAIAVGQALNSCLSLEQASALISGTEFIDFLKLVQSSLPSVNSAAVEEEIKLEEFLEQKVQDFESCGCLESL